MCVACFGEAVVSRCSTCSVPSGPHICRLVIFSVMPMAESNAVVTSRVRAKSLWTFCARVRGGPGWMVMDLSSTYRKVLELGTALCTAADHGCRMQASTKGEIGHP